jgi:hypothetical protein
MEAISAQTPTEMALLLKRESSAVVPAFVREINRQGLFNDRYVRASREVIDNILAQIPGASDLVPPATDVFGYPLEIPVALGPDLISAMGMQKKRNEPHYKALLDSKIGLMPPGDSIEGRQTGNLPSLREPDPRDAVKLTPQEQYRYQVLTGHEVRLPTAQGEKTFEGAVKEMIQTDLWKGATDSKRQQIITWLHTGYKRAARQKLIEENPRVREAVRQRMIERENAKGPRK